ncbi:regulatory Fis family protein [Pontibacter ummariensis]|uniref:Regulatory protein, Fis family n=1 Tax=Pontibacter ummariensis TaxID=1610492 RepID=A0A239KJ62_9BACT|nr:helix-turn-helix domain-containing protein [Pontibacter ummariensis]PRY05696.1 regulatory Fis family protein [Pontibacter ummariensis]SNT18417.1 regulatory protein, Fis family [Pontibacter ummariensis]
MKKTDIKSSTHRGEIIRDAIKASGVAVGIVAEKLGISRKTLYNKFKESSIPYSFILKLGEVIHHDFSQEFPHLSKTVKKELPKAPSSSSSNLLLPFDGEPQETAYRPNNTKEYEQELVTLQRKYITLLEKFNDLLLKTAQ